jgi:hypothetical protein
MTASSATAMVGTLFLGRDLGVFRTPDAAWERVMDEAWERRSTYGSFRYGNAFSMRLF